MQITMAEDVGVADRCSFYDAAGALRDVVQNHLLQIATKADQSWRPAHLNTWFAPELWEPSEPYERLLHAGPQSSGLAAAVAG